MITCTKISPKMVNPRDTARTTKEEDTSDLNIVAMVATLPGAWHCRVSARTGWPVSGWDSKFDLQQIYQCGNMPNVVKRSETHFAYCRDFKQARKKIKTTSVLTGQEVIECNQGWKAMLVRHWAHYPAWCSIAGSTFIEAILLKMGVGGEGKRGCPLEFT